MFLLADRIRLPNQAAKFFIEVRRLFNSEMVNVIAPGNRVYLDKAWPVVSLRQNQMPCDPRTLDPYGGKGHAHLESDSRLFRQYDNRATAPHPGNEQLVEFLDLFRFSLKV